MNMRNGPPLGEAEDATVESRRCEALTDG